MNAARNKKSNVPSAYCLNPSGPAEILTQRCECKNAQGVWLVDHEGKRYTFEPSTQLQKDIWLSGAKTPTDKEARVSMLRWLCLKCGFVQMP